MASASAARSASPTLTAGCSAAWSTATGFPEVGTIELVGAALPGTNWLSRRSLQVIYDYPFYTCGCFMVIQTTMADNEEALLVKAKLGFTLHRIKHLGGRGRDGVVGTFTVDDWENCKFNANRTSAA